MIRIEMDDRRVAKRMKKMGIYHKLMGPLPNVEYPTLIYRTPRDIFVRFAGRKRARDNGLIWAHSDGDIQDAMMMEVFMGVAMGSQRVLTATCLGSRS